MKWLMISLWLTTLPGAETFGPGKRFHLARGAASGVTAIGVVESRSGNRRQYYSLPQSTAAQYRKLRREDLRVNPYKADNYERKEEIGPHQVEGDRLWLGKTFYDGEGMGGVGAFGYFDTVARAYTLFSPPEVAPYSVTAILVTANAVWLGLDHWGEGWIGPGGLVRWDRATQQARKYDIEFIVTNIREEGNSLRLKTPGGYALLKDDEIQRFRTGGKPIAKFPPPPSHY